ncbi:hypothetical protein [Mycobacterium sp. 29Ha]|uniref:hypothetical protein n=1 Tax=Mycobacterium sp. 29Ha TaxID=2939268 RepID=UPI00293945AB|nr:hypothetical protein [Mycobacterium sp. 29Ha]MDV3136662.1 hypothetical protein [Mycobacterium sp. 29Ha]
MNDVGLRLLESLYEQMMIDEQWSIRRERGFTWWSYRLPQHVEVAEPVESQGLIVCTVRIWTDLVSEVDPETEPAVVLAPLNAQATLNALVWNSDSATISECCTAGVHEENFGWMSKVLATAAILQNASATNRARGIGAMTGGVPAASNHPSSGQRPDMDDILGVTQVVVQEGQQPSRFTGAGMEAVGRFLADMNFLGSTDATGLTCEVPFVGGAPAISLSSERGSTLQTSLVQVFTDVPHPEAGNGVLTIMRLPISADSDAVGGIANDLNIAEAQEFSPTQLLGAWCPDPSDPEGKTVAFCTFVPNMLARWVRIENLVLNASMHSRFAAEYLNQ